jgi:putative transposase
VVSHRRRPFLTEPSARQALHQAIAAVRAGRPFTLDALVLLPDHLHCLWTLPEDDADFSCRWQLIKAHFSRYYRQAGGVEDSVPPSRDRKQECGFWQRRFWEHTVRNEKEYEAVCDYIHL